MKVFTTLFALVFSGLVSASPINSIVVFGDSLSDNGNLYEFMQHKLPLSPPYYEGRFTNGPVWVERLTDLCFPANNSLRLLDYAFGGAGIAEDLEDDDALFTLKHEVDSYLISHEDKASPDSLFIIWIGANNYLAVPEDNEKAVHIVNTGINYDLERLAKKGAKHILILNLPDLSKTPVASEFEAEEKIAELVRQHNAVLANSAARLQQKYPDVQWIFYDIKKELDDIFLFPERYGFINTKNTCYDVKVDKPSQLSILQMASKVKMNNESDPCDGYLFFDPVHSTAPAHQITAQKVYDLLKEKGVEFAQ